MVIVLTDLPWFVQISCRCFKKGWILNFSSRQHFSALLTPDSATVVEVEAELGLTADAQQPHRGRRRRLFSLSPSAGLSGRLPGPHYRGARVHFSSNPVSFGDNEHSALWKEGGRLTVQISDLCSFWLAFYTLSKNISSQKPKTNSQAESFRSI